MIFSRKFSSRNVKEHCDHQFSIIFFLNHPFLVKSPSTSNGSNMDENEFHSKYAVDAGHAIQLLAKALNATEKHLQLLNQSLKNYTYARSDIFKLISTKLRRLTAKAFTVYTTNKMFFYFCHICHVCTTRISSLI